MKNRNFITRILLLATVIAIGSLLVFQPNSIGKDKAKQAPAPVAQTAQTSSYYDFDDGYYGMGVPWPDPRFTDNGDGTVTDNLTFLMWTKDSQQILGTMVWIEAIDSCEDLSLAEYEDWRLPNVKEMNSLVDYGRAVPYALALPNPFENFGATLPVIFWSSTTWDGTQAQAWTVHLGAGGIQRESKTSVERLAWCVRSDQ